MLGRELQEEVDGVVKQQDSNGVPGFRGAGLHNALLVGVANEREALHRAAIADLADLGELAKLRDFAREQWGEDPEFTRSSRRCSTIARPSSKSGRGRKSDCRSMTSESDRGGVGSGFSPPC